MPLREEGPQEYVIRPGLYDTEAGYVFHLPGEDHPRVLLNHQGLFTGEGADAPELVSGGVAEIIEQIHDTLFGRAQGAGTGMPAALSSAQARTILVISNIDNTSDANKPVSTAGQTALDLKANKALWAAKGDIISSSAASTPLRLAVGATQDHVLMIDSTTATGLKWAEAPGTAPSPPTGAAAGVLSGTYPNPGFADQAQSTFLARQAGAGTGPATALTASQARTAIELANVDNTSDANKPTSTAQQASIDTSTGLAVPKTLVDVKGDLIVATAADTVTRLAACTNDFVLTAASGEATGLKWAAVAGGSGDVATDTIWDAKGDLAGGTGANTAVKLTVGTNGFVLTADSGETTGMKWAAGAGSVAADAIFDAKGDLPVGTGSNTSARLATGTNGQALIVDTAASTGLAWSDPDPAIAAVRPTGAIAETVPRAHAPVWTTRTCMISGRMQLVGIALRKGVTVSTITFVAGAAVVTPTNQIFGIYNSSLVKKGETNNDTNTAWAINTNKTLTLGTPYVTEYTGLYYLAIMQTAGTVSTLRCAPTGTQLGSNAPLVHGNSSTGLTTSLPDPAGSMGVGADDWPIAWVS